MLIITYVLELSTEIGTVWVLKILLFFLIWGYFIIDQVILSPWAVAFYQIKKPFLFLLAWTPEEDFLFRWCPITPWCRPLLIVLHHPYATHSPWQSLACVVWSTLVDYVYYNPCYLCAHWCVSPGLTPIDLCAMANTLSSIAFVQEVIYNSLGASSPWLTWLIWCVRI